MPGDLLPIIAQIRAMLETIPVDIGPDVKLIQALLWLDDVRARVEKMAGEASSAG